MDFDYRPVLDWGLSSKYKVSKQRGKYPSWFYITAYKCSNHVLNLPFSRKVIFLKIFLSSFNFRLYLQYFPENIIIFFISVSNFKDNF